MKLRLCTVLGENLNFLTEYVQHYKKIGVSDFHFIVHAPKQDEAFYLKAKQYLHQLGIKNVSRYDGVWNGLICTNLLNSLKKRYPDDWFIVADQDEFQIYKDNIFEIIKVAEQKNQTFISGILLDRVSLNGKLSPSLGGNIWKKYPMCGFFSFPLTRANPYKIVLCKGNVELTEGQHGVALANEKYPVRGDILCQVHHFKWTNLLKEKLNDRLKRAYQGEWEKSYLGYQDELTHILTYIQKEKHIDVNNPLFLFDKIEISSFKYKYWDNIIQLTQKWDTLHSYNFFPIYDLAVIISSYNQYETIKRTVKILKKQALHLKKYIQVLIADDGSNKEQQFMYKKLLRKDSKYTTVQFLTQDDKGFRLASARNNALKKLHSKIVIFIDGDCIPDKDFLKYHLQLHQKQSKTICVGSRGYLPLFSLKSPKKKVLNSEILKKMEIIENSTIRHKSTEENPWRAVLGRNFSIKIENFIPLYDKNIEGWGFEDTDFAINLFKQGYTRIIFLPEAHVIQYDDFTKSHDPFKGKKGTIEKTLANAIYLMKKYKDDHEIYKELGALLVYFAIPYTFDGKKYILDENKKEICHKNISQGILPPIEDIKNLEKETEKNLLVYFTKNKGKCSHPSITLRQDEVP